MRAREIKCTERGAKSEQRKKGAVHVMANHFPLEKSQDLLLWHQGNGWCGADMLLWLAVLV